MPRSVPEWIGKSDDTPIPQRVKDRVLERYGHKCAKTLVRFDAKNRPEFDHIIPLALGGENRETNLQPLCHQAHKVKTAEDVKAKAKSARVRAKHHGISKKKRRMPYRKFDGTPVWPDRRE